MLYAFKLYKSRSVRDECAHESAHTHRRTHTGAHTHTHRHRHTGSHALDSTHTQIHILFYYSCAFFYFTLLYFLLFFSVLFQRILRYIFPCSRCCCLYFSHLVPPITPSPHKTKGNSCAGSANLCVWTRRTEPTPTMLRIVQWLVCCSYCCCHNVTPPTTTPYPNPFLLPYPLFVPRPVRPRDAH